MQHAFELAAANIAKDEVPVGAVVVFQDTIIAQASNQTISRHDPTAHAEILALRQAARHLKNHRLKDCTLYVTLEPCPMCAGAMIHSRLKELIFAAYDEKIGAVTGALELFDTPAINHQVKWRGGVMAEICEKLITGFFSEKR